MNWIENLLILIGISLDIFAGMECQGSLVAKVSKKRLAAICGLMTLWQLAALYIGQAKAVVFFLIVIVISLVQLHFTRSKEVQQ